MQRVFGTVGAIAGLAAAQPVAANDVSDQGAENWDGLVEFSASSATGNTENTVLGLRAEARRILGRYSHALTGAANYARATTTDDTGEEFTEDTQNNFFAQYRLDVQVADKTSYFTRVRYDQDEFSGFDQRAFVGAGVSHYFVEREDIAFQSSLGPGVRYTKLDPATLDPGEDGSLVEFAVFAGTEFDWVPRENVTLEHDFDTTYTAENTTFVSLASVKTDITETISTRLSFEVKHETDPPEGREATDTLLRASLGYGF